MDLIEFLLQVLVWFTHPGTLGERRVSGMIPDRLGDWTIEHVRGLAMRGVYESDVFDLKAMLPQRGDENGKHRLRKSCAAFANTKGGFLVFGVSDDNTKPPVQRVVGIDASVNFPTEFGNFPASCEPTVEWEPRNPALAVGNVRLVHVVFIPQSWKAPHAVEDGDGWVFPKRTSKGTEPMSYAEVQQMFLGYYEKRLKLQLLRAELVQLAELSDRIGISSSEQAFVSSHLPTLDLQVIETVLSDTYSITHSHREFVNCIALLRPIVRSLNGYIDTIRMSVAVYPAGGQFRVNTYLSTVVALQSQLKNLATQAITELDKIFK